MLLSKSFYLNTSTLYFTEVKKKFPSVKKNVLNLQFLLHTFHYPRCTALLVLFCIALEYRNILTNQICLLHVAQLWEWGHPSCSKPIRLNFSFCHVFASQKCTWWFTFQAFSGDVCGALRELYMEYAGSIINSAHFGHQRLGCSLQQCSALLLNAGARLFFPFSFCMTLFYLCPQLNPGIFCVHLILTLNPSSHVTSLF